MNKLTKMIVVLSVIGLVSGGILSLMYQWAEPKIKVNQIKANDAAVFQVVPGTVKYKQISDKDLTYFECYGQRGEKTGTAILCQGNGYQGVIKMMVGVNADFSKFTGMIVLEQVETPGLGAKIAEGAFTAQFKGLASKPPIEYVKSAKPSKLNQIEAITGATISSRAVVNIINKTVQQWQQAK
ncbi:MAG: RnfABCDGE type electron transport complex subunit G [Candidatus Saganbacteria bacterium]|nr:RnfABCDGE type electron transport complex subunit G [Candidatus Saganbacteria bacterium]